MYPASSKGKAKKLLYEVPGVPGTLTVVFS